MEREKDLLDRLYRRGRRLNLARRILSIVFLISGFIFAPTWVHLQLTYAPPNLTLDFIDVVSLVTGYIAIISYIGLVVMSRWARTDMEKRAERVVSTIVRLRKLASEHPELALLNEVTELLEEEKEQIANRRSFWVNILVNLLFTLLGFALSYTAAKLGWLR